MAMYHLSLHKDMKPDGLKVQGSNHVEYIRREGKFKDVDREPDNFIARADGKPFFGGELGLLYKSSYGNITNTPQGLKIDGNSSPTTIATALMIAHQMQKNGKLDLRGSEAFIKKAIKGATAGRLPVSFSNPRVQLMYDEAKEKIDDERRRFQESGGRIIERRTAREFSADRHRGKGAPLSQAPSIRDIPNMRDLPKFNVVNHGQPEPAMLLQDNEQRELVNGNSTARPAVRWNSDRVNHALAEKTAQRILGVATNLHEQVFAKSHVEYINREAAFKQRGGCVYTDNHLPKWAKGDAKKFFKAADRYEGVDCVRYLEFQGALPNELSIEQNLEIIHGFIEKVLPDHYYTFAIHDKVGSLSGETHNLHFHLMFSPRLIDDVEKEKERPASKYFLYPKRNAKTLKEKRQGGAPRERRMHDRTFIPDSRRIFAEVTNSVLEKYGCPDRVDHRSLKEMRKEALLNGDEYMAELLDRLPEKHIGAVNTHIEEDPKVKNVKLYRKVKYEVQTKLFETEKLKKEIRELQLQEEMNSLESLAEEILRLPEYAMFEEEHNNETDEEEAEDDLLYELKQDFIQALHEARVLSNTVLTVEEALTQAKLDHLPSEEREVYESYLDLTNQLERWEEFNASIDIDKDPPEYVALLPALSKKMDSLEKQLDEMKPRMDEINAKLTIPETLARVQDQTHRLLQSDRNNRRDYEYACKHLRQAATSLKNALTEDTIKENLQDTWTLKDLLKVLKRRYYGLWKEYLRAIEAEKAARKEYISPERAEAMAKNIYLKGAFKELRQERAALKKLSSPPADFDQQMQNIADREAALEEKCQTPEAILKIKDIKLGILNKNAAKTKAWRAANAYVNISKGKFEKAKAEYTAAYERSRRESGKTKYKVVHSVGGGGGYSSSPSHSQNMPSIIAEALQGGTPAVSAVARGEDRGMETSWKMMTVFEKEEAKKKALMREV